VKIIGLSDLHGDIHFLAGIENEIKSADLVLIAGDITNFGYAPDAEKIITAILVLNKNLVSITGNCDNRSVGEYIENKGISAERKVVDFHPLDLKILGFGGSVTTPVKTPNTFSESVFHDFFTSTDSSPDILLTHQPPYKTSADIVMGIKHVGSPAIRAFIDGKKPRLCLCGHIHESRGADYFGETLVVNPGPFKNGYYTIIYSEGNSGKFTAELLKI
jgi:Icc-related predicted phosphoesterase